MSFDPEAVLDYCGDRMDETLSPVAAFFWILGAILTIACIVVMFATVILVGTMLWALTLGRVVWMPSWMA